MLRQDNGLAALLRYENIAWFEAGQVRMLDRRVYPAQESFVICKTHKEVAQAITNMVTQSYGPFHAAIAGMILAAHEAQDAQAAAQRLFCQGAATTLATARPTTERKMRTVTNACERIWDAALQRGERPVAALQRYFLDFLEDRYATIAKVGRHFATLLPARPQILTQCYADCDLGMILRACREQGIDAHFFVPETRPYLQGARLTASVITDMGFPATLICDNMPAWTMLQKRVDVFTSAADVITLDGHVVNKVGTYQIAIAAQRHGIPYYCTGTPNPEHPTIAGIKIEERDPAEVLSAMGIRTAMAAVSAYYPAFDITPPELVTGIVTPQGVIRMEGFRGE